MYWHHPDWTTVATTELEAALTLVRGSLPETQCNAFHLRQPGHDGRGLPVAGIRIRRLPFQRDHWLYELDIATVNGSYASARAFVVLAAADNDSGAVPPTVDVVPHLRPQAPEAGPMFKASVLDWTSATLHQLNHDVPALLMRDGGGLDHALAIDYLDFFVSFLSDTNEGSGNPFLPLRGGTLGNPAGIDSQPGLVPFEVAIEAELLGGAPYRRPPRYDGMPVDGRQTDPPDVAEHGAAEGTTAPGDATPGAPSVGDPATPIADVAIVGEDPTQASIQLSATIQHKSNWFACGFQMRLPEEGGVAVSMLDETAIGAADPSLQQYQVGHLGDSHIRLLLLLERRREVTAAAFIELLRTAHADAAIPDARVENLRVIDNVDFRWFPAACPIHVHNVEFLGRVSLDECRRDTSTIFRDCRFARSLRARNCRIDGDLVLRGSTVLGVTRDRDPLQPAVCLAGLRITGDIDAVQLVADGEVDASGIRATGSVILCGVDIRKRVRSRESDVNGLSLRHADVKAGIDLSPHVQGSGIGKRIDRSRIEGDIELRGLHCLQLDLRGTFCFGHVNLHYANIRGPIDLGCFHPAHDDNAGRRLMRTIAAGSLDLRYAEACELFLAGAEIRGYLFLIGTKIAGGVYAGVDGFAYRCKIGKDAILSAARIGSDVDLDGASVEGGFVMRTGSLGRLFMCLQPVDWSSDGQRIIDYFSPEVGHLEMSCVAGLNAIGLAGIQIAGRNDGVPPLLLDQIDCAGSIGFAWSLRQKVEFAEIEQVLARPGPEPQVVVRRCVSERSCQSVVAVGDVEFKRVSAAGYVDLTNLKLGAGSVLLNDARIGTDLFARRSWLRGNDFKAGQHSQEAFGLSMQCRHLDLDNARIGGDALLSGVDLDGKHADAGNFSIVGRSLDVGGRFELHNHAACKARIPGGVDLSGAKIGELHLPGRNELCCAPSAPGSAEKVGPVVLERAHLGSLRMDHPLPKLNLTGIQVANWKLGVHGDTGDAGASGRIDTTLSILEAMDPTDRSVWTGVELELRNESQDIDADKVYRRMKDRETVRGFWQSLGKLLHRTLFGYGTNLKPALGLALLLALGLFGVLAQDGNVKLADGSLLQLANQCNRLGTVPGAALPTKCAVLGSAAAGTPEPTLELTARRLDSEGVPSGYGWSDAALLTLRYAIPFVGALGDPEWMPVEQAGVVVGKWHAPVPPAAVAAIVLLVNSILLSLVAAFFTRRLLR